jgi:hypothetical protein
LIGQFPEGVSETVQPVLDVSGSCRSFQLQQVRPKVDDDLVLGQEAGFFVPMSQLRGEFDAVSGAVRQDDGRWPCEVEAGCVALGGAREPDGSERITGRVRSGYEGDIGTISTRCETARGAGIRIGWL